MVAIGKWRRVRQRAGVEGEVPPLLVRERIREGRHRVRVRTDGGIMQRAWCLAAVLVAAGCGGSSRRNLDVAPQTVVLSVSVRGDGAGSVRAPSPAFECRAPACTQSVAKDTRVHLVASADEGSTFSGWGGACTG